MQKTLALSSGHMLMWDESNARHMGHFVESHKVPPWSLHVGGEEYHATSRGGLAEAEADAS